MKSLSLLLLLTLLGCNQQQAENQKALASLTERVEKLEASTSQQSNWVLWVTTEWVDRSKLNNFGWPKMLSSYNTREECFSSANKWTLPNGKRINDDPVTLSDGNITYIYSCLPPTVDMRVRPR
jgi:hypothetical protein